MEIPLAKRQTATVFVAPQQGGETTYTVVVSTAPCPCNNAVVPAVTHMGTGPVVIRRQE